MKANTAEGAAQPPVVPNNGQVAIHTFAQFLQMLEDGRLHGEMTDAINELNAAMNDHVQAYGNKAKGKLSLEVNFVLVNGVFEIQADFKTVLPKAPRDRSIAWSTKDNHFSPQNPKQMQLFGVRDVSGSGETRSV